MANCNIAIQETIAIEGGWSNHPSDHGGKTKYGITWKTLIRAIDTGLIARKNIQDLTIGDAQLIYYHFYWKTLRLDEVHSQKVANELFDTCVNMGAGAAARILQRALKLWYREIAIDGIVGAKTLERINNAPEHLLYKVLNILQGYRYIELCEQDISQMDFIKGWINNRVKL